VPGSDIAEPGPSTTDSARTPTQLQRLVEVMATLRSRCPWDSSQTHRSLVQYLVEETLEVVEAIEAGSRDDLLEELGDLLFQVVFHAEIAHEAPGGFDLEDVAREVADKLVGRHPHVFAVHLPAGPGPDGAVSSDPVPAEAVPPNDVPPNDVPPNDVRPQSSADVLADLNRTWEQRKAMAKGRRSVLEGIPDQLSAMAKATKIISRVRSREVPLPLPTEPVGAAELGHQVLELVARAHASGIDAEQAVRDAVRALEAQVQQAEA